MPIPGFSLVGLLDETQAVPYLQSQSVLPDPSKARSLWQQARAQFGTRAPTAPADIQPLPSACSAHVAATRAQARFSLTFPGPGVDFGLAEIAGLRACQVHVAAGNSAYPSPPSRPNGPISQELLDLCLPTRLPDVEPKWTRIGDENVGAISFYCGEDFEFRILAAGPWPPDPTTAAQGVGIQVGMGFGLVHVIRAGGQCYLANGYHRAVNLMLAGHTYMPCIIRDVDPAVNVPAAIGQALGAALSAATPPAVCGDYRLALGVPLRKRHRVINLSWSQTLVPDE